MNRPDVDNLSKIKHVYLPVICVGVACMLMTIQTLSAGKDGYRSLAHAFLIDMIGKAVAYGLITAACMLLCSWFGHPFESFLVSWLQIMAVALLVVGLGSLGAIGGYLKIAISIGLIGYFFSDNAIQALITIFLVYAVHLVVESALMPMLKVSL